MKANLTLSFAITSSHTSLRHLKKNIFQFKVKIFAKSAEITINCIGNVVSASSCDIITRISKWPIFGGLFAKTANFSRLTY